MVRIRRFEERSLRSYQAKKIGGFLHLYIGQESVAVGSMLSPRRTTTTSSPPTVTTATPSPSAWAWSPCMAELFGKKPPAARRARAARCTTSILPDNYWGGHGIVGGQIPLGTGLAYALKYKGLKGCAPLLHGRRCRQSGRLPRILQPRGPLVAPRHLRHREQRLLHGHLAGALLRRPEASPQRAEGYDMELGHHRERPRRPTKSATRSPPPSSSPTRSPCPSILEITTYRYRGHSVADPDKTYRDKEEIEEYKATKDPIMVFQQPAPRRRPSPTS